MTIFQKARLVVLTTAHSLLDRQIDMNNPGVVEQMIRDVGNSIEAIGEELVTARGTRTTVENEISSLAAQITRTDGEIDALLSDGDPSNDHHATTLQAQYDGQTELKISKEQEIEELANTIASLEEVLSAIEAKKRVMENALTSLRSKENIARAKNKSADALSHAAEVSSAVADISLSQMESKADREANIADERLKRAMGRFEKATGRDEDMASVAAKIAERKKRLQNQPAPVTS